jgi:hypothetical protein
MGTNESMTIYGNVSILMDTQASLGNIVALGTLSITAPTIVAIQTAPSISSDFLAFSGTFYVSESVHFASYYSPVVTGALSPVTTRLETVSSFISSQTVFKEALLYVPTNTPLNYDTGSPVPPPPPPPVPPFPSNQSQQIEAIVYLFEVSNSQLFYLLPLDGRDQEWPKRGKIYYMEESVSNTGLRKAGWWRNAIDSIVNWVYLSEPIKDLKILGNLIINFFRSDGKTEWRSR